MVDKIKSYVKTLFSQSNYSTELELFLVSKYPQSVGDIEHWTKEYDYKRNKSWA